jgi:hypothetical protein
MHFVLKLPIAIAPGLDELGPRFVGSRESFVEDRLNAKKAFCGLVHLSDNPVRGF